MTAPNHIAGGLFFTGFWCSFWEVNIFSQPSYLAATVICSLLPDIDKPSSPIGLAIYPVAKWINKKYGHRTITHSILFLIICTGITYLIQTITKSTASYHLILFFSVLSHLILDMLTITGVPLFYPFMKNPCVMPGNQNYRLNAKNWRSEIVAFMLFIALNFLCFDLYANGFWTQVNRLIARVSTVHYEASKSPNFLLIEYDYTINGINHKGIGTAIETNNTKLTLLTQKGLIELEENKPNQDIHSLKPIHTKHPFKIIIQNQKSISIDSLQKSITGKYLTGSVQSNSSFFVEDSSMIKNTTSINFKQKINPIIYTQKAISNRDEILAKIAIKQQSVQQHRLSFDKSSRKYYQVKNQVEQLKNELQNTTDIATKVTIENRLIKENAAFLNMVEPLYIEPLSTLEEIKNLQLQLNQKEQLQYFNTALSYPLIPTEILKQLIENTTQPKNPNKNEN